MTGSQPHPDAGSSLSAENEDLRKRIAQLERMNEAMMDRIERTIDSSGNAYSVFEANIIMQRTIDERTEALARANKALRIKISEKEDQIRLRRKRLTTAEDDLKKMIGRRGEILDKAGLQVRREKLVDRRRALEVAEAELVSAEANRARAIAEAVPYVPPGVREQFSLLLRTTFTDPVAGVLGALVFLFAMGVELGSFATAFSKRDSAYAIQLRDQLCDALHASETRKILNQSELEDLKWEKKQQRLWRGQQYSTSEKIVRGLEDIDPSAARKVA